MSPSVGTRYLNETMLKLMDTVCSDFPSGFSKARPSRQDWSNLQLAKQTCYGAAPRSSFSRSPYSASYSYCGVNANDMYYNAGDGDWANVVRGCLTCMDDFQISPHTAHLFCYDVASNRVQSLWSTARGYGGAVAEATLDYAKSAWHALTNRAEKALGFIANW